MWMDDHIIAIAQERVNRSREEEQKTEPSSAYCSEFTESCVLCGELMMGRGNIERVVLNPGGWVDKVK